MVKYVVIMIKMLQQTETTHLKKYSDTFASVLCVDVLENIRQRNRQKFWKLLGIAMPAMLVGVCNFIIQEATLFNDTATCRLNFCHYCCKIALLQCHTPIIVIRCFRQLNFTLFITDGYFSQAFVNTKFIIYSHKNTLFMNYARRMFVSMKLANDASKLKSI